MRWQMLDQLHEMTAIKRSRASATRPNTRFAPQHGPTTGGALIAISIRPTGYWYQSVPDIFQRTTDQIGDLNSDPIIAVPGMAATIAIEPMPHMEKFLSNDDLDPLRLMMINSGEIDEDQVMLMDWMVNIGTPYGRRHTATEPSLEKMFVAGDEQRSIYKLKPRLILFQEFAHVVWNLEALHDFTIL